MAATVEKPGRSRPLVEQALALVVGAAGGAVAARAGMPLAWMLGSMIATTLAAMGGAPLRAPASARLAVIPIIGVLLGSSLNREIMAAALAWLPSLLLMPLFIAAASLSGATLYRRLGGYDRTTAYFSAVPGGLNEMILFAAAYGGDERRVALAQGLRILISVTVIGLVFGYGLGAATGADRPQTALAALGTGDWLWLGGAALAGGLLSRVVPVPAGSMILPMLLSAALHVAEVVTVPPPTLLVNLAMVVMGATIGARFRGLHPRHVLPDLGLGLLSTAALLLLALLFSRIAHLFSDMPVSQSFLAFAPGGLTEMSLIALGMGQQVAYVSVSHLVRIFVVVLTAPLVFAKLRARRDRAKAV